jgi:hypothetical protein
VSDDLREAIREDAARLDAVRPGWAAEIDRARLNMANCRDCVYGQLFGHYLDVLHAVRMREPRLAARIKAACDPGWGQARRYRVLWLAEVAARTGEPA